MIAGLEAGVSVATARRLLTQVFRQQDFDTPELDARVLIGHALALDHSTIIAAADRALNADDAEVLTGLAERRLAREPVARITGKKEFWGLLLKLNSATLVPRPETETVIEAALAAVEADAARDQTLAIADLGTGTGALLLALLSELPHAYGIGTDLSVSALRLACENARDHRLAVRGKFVACDFGAALGSGFDLVVSNPPYIRRGDIAGLDPEVSRYDPVLALDGGSDGLDCYRAIARDAWRLLRPHGHLVVELGADQAHPVAALFQAAGLVCPPPRHDLAGVPRALLAQLAA
jgi:release factor glutamine methyltransferase